MGRLSRLWVHVYLFTHMEFELAKIPKATQRCRTLVEPFDTHHAGGSFFECADAVRTGEYHTGMEPLAAKIRPEKLGGAIEC